MMYFKYCFKVMLLLLVVFNTKLMFNIYSDSFDPRDGSSSNLKRMYALFWPRPFLEKNIPALLEDKASDIPKIVSAELIFNNLVKEEGFREPNPLLAQNYKKAVEPKNPAGKTDLDKWGSSLYTWSMTAEKWNWAVEFELHREDSGPERSIRGFPILWDKRPDLQNGKVCVLHRWQTGSYVTVLEDKEFQICLGYVKKWLELCDKDVPEILKLLEAGDVHEKRLAIKALGIRKASGTLPVIIEKMMDPSLRGYALEALARIKDEKAVPSLVKAFYALDFDSAVVITMCEISGEQVHRELKDWLNDPGMSSGRKSSIMYGIWRADYKPGRGLIEPFLKSKDKELREAAEQALERLGKE